MIKTGSGNLLAADVDALVNTVNTVGVMGKGIALQFRRAYPEMFKAYVTAAKAGEVELGRMHVWPTHALDGPRYVISFPTKAHWRAPSRLRDIEAGLVDLVRVVEQLSIRSIAVPPLGCGNGGLDWREVEPLIHAAFDRLPKVDVRLYPPGTTPRAAEMATATARPAMTPGRAALVRLLSQYQQVALGATPIEVQKLMYFLQVAGERLSLTYAKGLYGPYADNLRHVLVAVEGHFLTGFGDASAPALEAEPIEVLPGADEEAADALATAADTRVRIDRVLDLIGGFESMYGLELLASVHWLVTHDADAARDVELLTKRLHEWTPRKGRTFTPEHASVAMHALTARGWLVA